MKDTLSKLKEQKKIWISPKHPMYFEPLEDRILYCSGVFHFVLISNQGSPLSNFELNRLVKAGLELGIGRKRKEARTLFHFCWTRNNKRYSVRSIPDDGYVPMSLSFLLGLCHGEWTGRPR